MHALKQVTRHEDVFDGAPWFEQQRVPEHARGTSLGDTRLWTDWGSE